MTDPRMSALLGRAEPWWLWTLDGQRLVLTNEAGARAMGATGIGIALERSYSADHAFAGQIARIAAQLPETGELRLERLREFGRASSAVILAQARRLTIDGNELVLLTTAPSGLNNPLLSASKIVEALPMAALLYHADGRVAAANMAAKPLADIAFDVLVGEAANSIRTALGRDGWASIDLVTGAFSVSSVVENELMLGAFSLQAAVEEPATGLRLVPSEDQDVRAMNADTGPEVPLPSAPALSVVAPRSVPAEWLQTVSRLVWRTDAQGLHVEEPKGLAALLNQPSLTMVGRSWSDLAGDMGAAIPSSMIEAMTARDVWSGVEVLLPIKESPDRVHLMMSAVPARKDGQFDGFRGFAIATRVPGENPAPQAEHPQSPDTSETLVAEAAVEAEAPPAVSPSYLPPVVDSDTSDIVFATDNESGTAPEMPALGEDITPVDAPARPTFTVHEKPANVFALRNGQDARRGLSPLERHAFREIAKALNARVEGDDGEEAPHVDAPLEALTPMDGPVGDAGTPFGPTPAAFIEQHDGEQPVPDETIDAPVLGGAGSDDALTVAKTEPVLRQGSEKSIFGILDSVQLGVVVHRGNAVLFANRPLLDWTGYRDMQELDEAGGVARLFAEEQTLRDDDNQERPDAVMIVGKQGQTIPVAARLARIPWEGETALMFALRRVELQPRLVEPEEDGHSVAETTLADVKSRLDEVEGILDTATDGIVIVQPNGQIESLNRSAEALFGYEAGDVKSRPFVMLFAPESHGVAQDYLEGLSTNGVASILNDGREIVGRVKQGGLIPLYMTLGRIGTSDRPKFAAVFRDMTQWKKAEEELLSARRTAEKASSHKSDFLAKISHEIRTPLNAIIGFSEVMMEERFGPIGNQRYKDYLRDIHLSGGHVLSLINDLLDLSKIEAGKLELNFASVDLNAVVQQCVAIMQPQANREKVIIRSSLAHHLPNVVADDRSIRQVVLNLLTNSVKFTPPGGQVIISTAFSDQGEAVLRVRDTGVGMTEAEIKVALEPFRQITTSQTEQTKGTGLGLPLTKALVEANRASFGISSHPGQGTMIEIVFPATRVLAE